MLFGFCRLNGVLLEFSRAVDGFTMPFIALNRTSCSSVGLWTISSSRKIKLSKTYLPSDFTSRFMSKNGRNRKFSVLPIKFKCRMMCGTALYVGFLYHAEFHVRLCLVNGCVVDIFDVLIAACLDMWWWYFLCTACGSKATGEFWMIKLFVVFSLLLCLWLI